jgi:hypothetical protein
MPATYVLRVQGALDAHWAAWFVGMTVTGGPDGTTTITGQLIDQAALHGVLRKIRDLGLTLLSCNVVPEDSDADLSAERHD